MIVISVVTAGLIALILLVIYRSLFTALLPLLVIGVSLAVGRGVLSALGEAGMPVSRFTIAFMTAILLGAGTDYSAFLISRYHEQRRQDVSADLAVINATATIGRVILASAATVAFAFLAMVLCKAERFWRAGPSVRDSRLRRSRGHRDIVPSGIGAGRQTAALANPKPTAHAATGTGSPWP
ncbi:hypothetical protein MAHJHV58_50100 [Mycobacterium avium subsp. hominissuis]|uniref:Membrane transport protein MMPL domain-containing protein n=3 Tax=Mycobacterium TaxID=1763 RepID=A0A7I7Z2T3_9MYCO|nr:MmpL family transport protein [Mycobacterium intracellulare subsp. chimaera]KDO98236.1 hypothetical protein MAV100_26875 [Mycobacterium avium subsp. hominissuis 100]BBN46423.1 hypothetical protein JPH1_08980 [Mycobacterium avium subsp. hominissuis]BBZ47534.1 hypothetical protein MPRM_48150 [Mycobacterium parmense]BCP19090.1 hypothetical protein MINTM023_08790 [Mycobacterium intracellulare]GFG66503.1 hypothetical protein MKUB_39930 [Mycobacterium kubicae]